MNRGLRALVLVVGLVSFAGTAKAEFESAAKSLKNVQAKAEKNGTCIESIGEAECRSWHEVYTILDQDHKLGVVRMYSCDIRLAMRYGESIANQDFLSSMLIENDNGLIWTIIPKKEVSNAKKAEVEADLAEAKEALTSNPEYAGLLCTPKPN